MELTDEEVQALRTVLRHFRKEDVKDWCSSLEILQSRIDRADQRERREQSRVPTG